MIVFNHGMLLLGSNHFVIEVPMYVEYAFYMTVGGILKNNNKSKQANKGGELL